MLNKLLKGVRVGNNYLPKILIILESRSSSTTKVVSPKGNKGIMNQVQITTITLHLYSTSQVKI